MTIKFGSQKHLIFPNFTFKKEINILKNLIPINTKEIQNHYKLINIIIYHPYN